MVKNLIPLEQNVHINPPISKLHWSWCFYYSNRKETLKLFGFHQGSPKAGGAGGKAGVGSTEKTPGGEAFVQAHFRAGGLLVQWFNELGRLVLLSFLEGQKVNQGWGRREYPEKDGPAGDGSSQDKVSSQEEEGRKVLCSGR